MTLNQRPQLILNFHGVGSPPRHAPLSEHRYWLNQEAFKRALDAVSQAQSTRDDLDIRATFDDGNASDAEIAAPELLSRGLTAIFFVCARRVGDSGYMDGQTLRALAASNMTIGSHGAEHRNWRQTSREDLDYEIHGARSTLEDILGNPVEEVAIPFGAYDRRVLKCLKAARFRRVYTSDGGIAGPSDWLATRNTITVESDTSAMISKLMDEAKSLMKFRAFASRIYKRLR